MRRITKRRLALLLTLLAAAALSSSRALALATQAADETALAEVAEVAEAPETGGGGGDPIARHLFPPDLILGHAHELGLDEAQRQAVRSEIQKAQNQVFDAQLQMQEEVGSLERLLDAQPIDEAKVLAEVDRILTLEKQVKKAQLALLVRLKNRLTPAQQARLTEIRKSGGG